MNRELYIHTLRMLREQYEIARMDTVVETIDAALAEFERPTDSDCISRQAAIDAVKGRFSMPVDNLIVEVIGALPSAQPEDLFEIGKPHPLKGYEFKMWKDVYGDDWVEIRKYQEPLRGEEHEAD